MLLTRFDGSTEALGVTGEIHSLEKSTGQAHTTNTITTTTHN